ncbi:hypothetical protein [Microbacterium sp. IEGM 1404]|uniref:hypothetical protein n=1 Tax=Microbacterium sp. IEGM 1404 TaxID=3047084 RepID=UPI0024B694D6|nr:hypothetical protein [Microbacterium sp. IEGM 1404]MDI9889948.1 hypothetical protein [Microbacterium sp. IEGM 1404]
MTNPGDPVRWAAIDREAALRERFPSLQQVRNERPGCEADRTRQVFWHAQNRAAIERVTRSRIEQNADADAFIAAARKRQQERLRVWAKTWKQQHTNEGTRTA